MSGTGMDSFWTGVAALIGDRYRPHTAEYGVFLFNEKLRRHGFDEGMAPLAGARLVARAVPWAMFSTLGSHTYLTICRYGRPEKAFSCFDRHFNLHLARSVPEWDSTPDETAVLVRISPDALAAVEEGRVVLRDAFRHAEGGFVVRVRTQAAESETVACGVLRDMELPRRNERVEPSDQCA